MNFSIDIEVTNRCNAKCTFCPRDQTPHQGLMSEAVFSKALERAIEFRPFGRERVGWDTKINLCGLGEPLLNKNLASWVRRVRAEGFTCGLSSNGALLDERRSAELLDAGLNSIFLNIGDVDDDYEEIYGLPFEKSRANVARFIEEAKDRCEVHIVLVDHRHDPEHLAAMKAFWGGYGAENFVEFDVINRGGALFVDHMQYEQFDELAEAERRLAAGPIEPVCGAPFGYMFVGYDGKYYLCCSDWRKEIAMSDVFETSFIDLTEEKFRHVLERSSVCRTCNLDPTNRLAGEIRAQHEGLIDPSAVDQVASRIAIDNQIVVNVVEDLVPGTVEQARRRRRRTIPVGSF